MNNEVELKLAVSAGFAAFLSQEISAFRILSQKTQFLANAYYDTPQYFFAARHMGLRVRQADGRFTFTLKTDGKTLGGLHIRPEYNIALDNAQPDLPTLVDTYQLAADWRDVTLQRIFSTDFERRCWLVECGNGVVVEIALDQGEIRAGDKCEPICEVEFELKQGRIKDLLHFVAALSLENGVRLSAASKAQRGYRLAGQKNTAVKNWSDSWREFLHAEAGAGNSQQKLTALFQLEQDLIEDTFALGADYFAADFVRTVERIGAFFNLYHYYTEHGALLESVLHARREKGQTTDDGQDALTAIAESNARLLSQLKTIIRRHSETKLNRPALETLFELLQSAPYVKRMLHLISLSLDDTEQYHHGENS
ncbi:inorganic triphosphatase [Necropsobacter rosorum]|uniref:CYTH domain-containing protein n=1 Tax=Necropsobacter rosorum TaxID=908285 RepID=UPI000509992D